MDLQQAALGYLTTLGVEPVLAKLTDAERAMGDEYLLGCLDALTTHLHRRGDPTSASVAEIIEHREDINGTPAEGPDFKELTERRAQQLYNFYDSELRAR